MENETLEDAANRMTAEMFREFKEDRSKSTITPTNGFLKGVTAAFGVVLGRFAKLESRIAALESQLKERNHG